MKTSKGLSHLYIGSGEKGIHASILNEGTREVTFPVLMASTVKSFFIVLHPSKPFLYSVDLWAGTVDTFKILPEGGLALSNQVESQGGAPCHLAFSPDCRHLIAVNYDGGISIFSVGEDGALAKAANVFQFKGKGLDPQRQSQSHPHGVCFVTDRLAYIADLGADRFWAVEVNKTSSRLLSDFDVPAGPGSGPRHFVVSPNKLSAVAVNELSNELSTFFLEPGTGRLKQTGRASTVPDHFQGETHAAEAAYHPGGRACYASNRGHDSLAIFSIDRHGMLLAPQWIESGGKRPEHFQFNATGTLLYIANSGSNQISIHKINSKTGLPGGELGNVSVPKPMCVALVP